METTTLIPIDLIDGNPYQPRQTEDAAAIAEIAESIKRNGLMQTPSARQVNGHYQLAFGHTRLAAFRLNGEECMPLIIRELDDLQMFELGVSENIKRRDLNPIEQAEAMKRYMQEFQKTSAQASEFFNVSEEQVRATVRLINLVPEAQRGLAEGKINITTARTLLSIQKIAPEKVIVETLKKIEKNPGSLPEEVIEHSIERMDEVVDMWSDGRDGKPRSSYHGWLLDMKNFPNKLLPALTPVDIAIALGIQDDPDMMSRATAFLQSKLGELDEADLELLGLQMSDLQIPADLAVKIDHLIDPPACTACPFYTKIRGSHFCGIKTCHTRKAIAWHTSALQQASKNLGIELYQKSDGAYRALDSDSRSLFKNRHKGLRLLPKDQFKGYAYQYGYEGVDTDIFVVVATGDAIDKMTTSSSRGGKKTEKEKAEMRMMKIYRLRRKELLWEFTGVAQSIFEGVPVAAVKRMSAWKFVGIDDQIREEWKPTGTTAETKAAHEKRLLVWKLISDVSSHYSRRSMASMLKDLQEKANEWGIKIPKGLISKAMEWDAEIASVTAVTAKKNGKVK
jgi:ParB family transcriptional regulator, chromosome partitioning protein